MEFTFPFEVPDLSTASDELITETLSRVREFAAGLHPDGGPITEDTLNGLRACRDLATAATAELSRRRAATAEVASLAAELAATDEPDPVAEPTIEPAIEPEPVTAATRAPMPTVRDVARRTTIPPAVPDAAERNRYATMRASANVPSFTSGQELATFADASRALEAQLRQYPQHNATHHSGPPIVVVSDRGSRHVLRDYVRHGAVQFVRQFPAELTVTDGARGLQVAEYAASERRLPGGSLVRSAQLAVDGGRALTAAAGWCAPSESIYDLCELESLDGLLDLPELQTDRGGWQIPAAGGPNFATIWDGIGCTGGDTHLTEAEVIQETAKCCYEIPCPEFVDTRLGVDYFCLTGSLLQRRGYPELVARFGRGAIVALAHKINMGVIAAIVTAGGAAIAIPADPSGDDAISGLMSAVDLAVVDAKYRNRMTFASSLEIVLPMWVLAQLRASKTRRGGVDPALVDAEIMAWFAARKAVPRFVYDWQDAFSGLMGGPGGAVPLTVLPTTVDFLIYPAGTFVKAVQSVVNLDTIYDSTRLTTNEYTAAFVEDGWAVLQMCPYVHRYTAVVDPSGVVGCCAS